MGNVMVIPAKRQVGNTLNYKDGIYRIKESAMEVQ